jgi:hypothetical protein
VRLARGIRDQRTGERAEPIPSCAGPDRRALGDQQSEKIRHRRAGHEQAGSVAWETDRLGHPARDLALDVVADVVAPAAVHVEAAGDHLRDHADGRAGTVHPAHEAGVQIAVGIGSDVPPDIVQHIGELARTARQRRVEAVAACLGRFRQTGRSRTCSMKSIISSSMPCACRRNELQSAGSRSRAATGAFAAGLPARPANPGAMNPVPTSWPPSTLAARRRYSRSAFAARGDANRGVGVAGEALRKSWPIIARQTRRPRRRRSGRQAAASLQPELVDQ